MAMSERIWRSLLKPSLSGVVRCTSFIDPWTWIIIIRQLYRMGLKFKFLWRPVKPKTSLKPVFNNTSLYSTIRIAITRCDKTTDVSGFLLTGTRVEWISLQFLIGFGRGLLVLLDSTAGAVDQTFNTSQVYRCSSFQLREQKNLWLSDVFRHTVIKYCEYIWTKPLTFPATMSKMHQLDM